MDTACLEGKSTGVRTVLHISPSVMAAAVVSAQRNGLNLREWLERAVASLIDDDHAEGSAPWSVQAAELFAQVASCSPELLRGRWALLYEHIHLCDWALRIAPLPPLPMSPDEAIALAERVHKAEKKDDAEK